MVAVLSDEDLTRIRTVVSSKGLSFNALVKLAQLDPAVDFQHQNLSHLDFGRADLSGFSFAHSDLSYSNLEECIINEATILTNVRAEHTRWPSSASFLITSEKLNTQVSQNRQDARSLADTTSSVFLFMVFVSIDEALSTEIVAQLRNTYDLVDVYTIEPGDAESALSNLMRKAREDFIELGHRIIIIIIDKNRLRFQVLMNTFATEFGTERAAIGIEMHYITINEDQLVSFGRIYEGGYIARSLYLPQTEEITSLIVTLVRRSNHFLWV